jgi:peptidoglycan/xylan/chitin deacetylase (PgdA/CDA1 family)
VEKNLPATYFLIPFKHTVGDNVRDPHASRRATAYDVSDLLDWMPILQKAGCELGVHGIDAWHSVEKGRAELGRIADVTGGSKVGIRMHWLLQNSDTISVLEKAGYEYDSTAGYNETTGYRNGTLQVFRPLGAGTLLELPVHAQDGTLFYPNRLDLSESQANELCKDLIANNLKFGGVFTVIWHDRSHGPERFWGDFYVDLVQTLKSSEGWFATGAQAVHWFRKRRQARFERLESGEGVRVAAHCNGGMDLPSMRLRVYRPIGSRNRTELSQETAFSFADFPWNAQESVEYDAMFNHLPNDQINPS